MTSCLSTTSPSSDCLLTFPCVRAPPLPHLLLSACILTYSLLLLSSNLIVKPLLPYPFAVPLLCLFSFPPPPSHFQLLISATLPPFLDHLFLPSFLQISDLFLPYRFPSLLFYILYLLLLPPPSHLLHSSCFLVAGRGM